MRRAGRELAATGLRLVAYVGALALTALAVLSLLPKVEALTYAPLAAERPQWLPVERPHPAFAISLHEMPDTTYRALRESAGGGRKDVIILEGQGREALVEIYRPGSEPAAFGAPDVEMLDRAKALGAIESVDSAPAIETRFGPVSLMDFTLADDARRGCLAFLRALSEPPLQISGWFCNAGPGMVDRSTVACAFDKLTLLASGSDPRLAKTFAQADLKGASCVHKRARPSAARPRDWIDGRQATRLRRSVLP